MVNRLEDSLLLWKAICESKLLAKAILILFLNKCDILKQKIQNGTQLSMYLSGYGDKPNDAASFIKCATYFTSDKSSRTYIAY